VTRFTPTLGAPGKTVTLTGANFTGVTAVHFNGLATTFRVVSDKRITATVPANATTGPSPSPGDNRRNNLSESATDALRSKQ
jgi:hypothetical protein